MTLYMIMSYIFGLLILPETFQGELTLKATPDMSSN